MEFIAIYLLLSMYKINDIIAMVLLVLSMIFSIMIMISHMMNDGIHCNNYLLVGVLILVSITISKTCDPIVMRVLTLLSMIIISTIIIGILENSNELYITSGGNKMHYKIQSFYKSLKSRFGPLRIDEDNPSAKVYYKYKGLVKKVRKYSNSCSYDTETRTIRLKSFYRKETLIHEYGHAIDHLYNILRTNDINNQHYMSSKHEAFKTAIDNAMTNEVIWNYMVEQSPEIKDIVSALTLNKYDSGRDETYWEDDMERVYAEIFANIFAVEVLGISKDKSWIYKNIREISDAYDIMIKEFLEVTYK